MLSHVLLPSLAVPDMPSTQTGAGTRPRASSAAGWSWSVWLVGSIETKGTATPSRAGGKFCFATGFSSVRAELFGMPRRLLAPSCSLTRVCVSEGRVAPQASSSERPSVMKSGKRMRQLVSDGVFPKLVATIKGVDSHQFQWAFAAQEVQFKGSRRGPPAVQRNKGQLRRGETTADSAAPLL